MDLSLLEERLDAYGSSGFYLLESFLLNLLQLEAKAGGKSFDIGGRGKSKFRWDAFAPEGLADIHSPLAIEVVRVLSPKQLEICLSRLKAGSSPSDHLLIVSLRQLGMNSVYFSELKRVAGDRIHLWGEKELGALIEKHKHAALEMSERLFSLRLKTALSTSDAGDWKLHRDKVIAEVRENYASGRFSLFLGAGVSSSAGLPDWDTLLNSLLVSMLSKSSSDTGLESDQTSSIVRRLRDVDGPSALVLARYVRKGMAASAGADQVDFIHEVTHQLYALRNKNHSIDSKLIKEIASLCMPTRTGAKVRAVVTYNFDDLVERGLKARDVSFRSIFEELDLASSEELPVYHVHGFLPEHRADFPNIDKSTLVFSEEGYHQIYRDAYHWSNLVQLSCFKETSCLMIGLSLADPNLRRLLEISSKSADKSRHFAFLKRLTYESFSKEDGRTVVRAPAGAVRDFLSKHHSLNEEVMRELGVNVIWYEQYDDIPRLLASIKGDKTPVATLVEGAA